jgi:hypothetical protein
MRTDKREGKYKEYNRAGTSPEEKAGGGSARLPCIGAMQLYVGSESGTYTKRKGKNETPLHWKAKFMMFSKKMEYVDCSLETNLWNFSRCL